MRLNKFIAQSGLCSRRKADEWIEQGQVTLNGKLVTQLATQVDPTQDTVTVNGQKIEAAGKILVVMLHKPTGYATTKSDPHAEKTIYDLLPSNFHHLNPVGRLDQNSEGLILLTNDGALTQSLTHAKHGHEKKYVVKIKGFPKPEQLKQLQEGIDIEEEKNGVRSTYRTRPCTLRRQAPDRFEVTLNEGRKRQIRKMFSAIGCPVLYLKRISMGPFNLGDLPKGQWKMVSEQDTVTERSND